MKQKIVVLFFLIFSTSITKSSDNSVNYTIDAIATIVSSATIGGDIFSEEKGSLARTIISVGALCAAKKLDENKFPFFTCCTTTGIIASQIYIRTKDKKK